MAIRKKKNHREDNHPLEVFKARPDKALTAGLSLCPTLPWAASRMRDLLPQVSSHLSDSVTPYLLRAHVSRFYAYMSTVYELQTYLPLSEITALIITGHRGRTCIFVEAT